MDFLDYKTRRNSHYNGFHSRYYTLARNIRELQPPATKIEEILHYTLARNIRELLQDKQNKA